MKIRFLIVFLFLQLSFGSLLAQDGRIIAPVTPHLPDCVFLVVSSMQEVPAAANGMIENLIANPEDDSVRAALADWLEENGLEDRAEFMRVQLELSSILKTHEVSKISDLANPQRAQALRDRAVELLSAHPEWTPNTHSSVEYVFERGVITRATIDVSDLLAGLNQADALEELSSLLPYLRTTQEFHLDYVKEEHLDLLKQSGVLEMATLVRVDGITDVSVFEGMTKLKTLHLIEANLEKIDALGSLTNLRTLTLMGEPEISILGDLSPLSNLNNLEHLDLSFQQVTNFALLSNLRGLKTLQLEATGIEDPSILSNLNNLVALGLRGNQISDISSLSNLGQIQFLNLAYNPVTNISSLSHLSTLRHLGLDSTNVGDLSPLLSLTNLQQIDLSSLQGLAIGPLVGLQNSPELYIGTTMLTQEMRTQFGNAGIEIRQNTADFLIADSEYFPDR